MALVTANGLAVLDAAICMPRIGAWHADLRVDTPDAITGPVRISIDEDRLVLNGTVWRGGMFAGSASVRVVAGANGLRTVAKAKHYTQTSARIVLGDLLSGVGEKLSSTASSSILARHLDAWTTAAIATGGLITRLLAIASPGSAWRFLPNGQIWIGAETWPDSGLTDADFQDIDENPAVAEALIGVEAPVLLPGTTLLGRRVSYVEHLVNEGGVRSKVFFESDDRLKDAFAAAVRASLPPLTFFACHWARVIAQNGATVDVEIENPTIAKFLPSMSGVPLMMPAPGATMQMAAIGRVLIGWSDGDQSRPFAIAYDVATALIELVLNSPDLRLGDDAAQAFPNGAFFTALQTLLNGLSGAASTALGVAVDPGALSFLAAVVALVGTFELTASTYLTTKAKAT
jgi:hypothetical protein